MNWDDWHVFVTNGTISSYLCRSMDAQRRETLITRLTSVGFFVVALAVFKPLGQVERIVSREGNLHLVVRHCAQPLPVSRSHAAGVKARIKR